MNVSAAMQMHNKMPVIGLAGKVKHCRKLEMAPSQYDENGVRKISFVLEDDSGEIWVNVFSPKLDDYSGLELEISAYENKKSGLSGAKISRYTDKKGEEKVSITATGNAIKVVPGEPVKPAAEQAPRKTNQGGSDVTDNELAVRMLRIFKFFAVNGVEAPEAEKMAVSVIIALNDRKCEPVPADKSKKLSTFIDE